MATLTAYLPPYDGFVKPAYPEPQLADRYHLLLRDYAISRRESDAVVWRRLYATLYKRAHSHLPHLNAAYAAVMKADIAKMPTQSRVAEAFRSSGNDVPRTFATLSSIPGDDRWQNKKLTDYVAYCLSGDPSGWLTLAEPAVDPPIGPVADRTLLRKQVRDHVTMKEDIEDRADGMFLAKKDAASVVSKLIRDTTPPPNARDVDRLLVWARDKTQSNKATSGPRNAADAFGADVSEVPEDIKGVTKGQFADWWSDRYVRFAELQPLQKTAVMVAYSSGVAPDEESRKLRKMAFATSTQMGRELLLYVMNHDDFKVPLASLARLFERIEKVTADGIIKESKAAGTLDETGNKRGRGIFNERFVQAYLEHSKLMIGLRLNGMSNFMQLRASMGSKLVSDEQLSGLVSDMLLMLKQIGN